MQETPQQYTQRILAYTEGRNPLEILASTPARIVHLLAGTPKGKLQQRPAPGKWSVTEILAHLADSEMVYGYRIRLILEGSCPPIQATNQDLWAQFSQYSNQDVQLSVEGFRSTRERTVALLAGLPAQSWDLYGIHTERGKETVRRVVEMLAGHDINHLKQIEERLVPK